MRQAVHQNYEASVSGGSKNTTVYSSLGYQKQEGLVENSSMERYSGRFNVQQKIGQRGEAGANLMFSQVNQEMNEERTSSINPFYCMAVATPPPTRYLTRMVLRQYLSRDERKSFAGYAYRL